MANDTIVSMRCADGLGRLQIATPGPYPALPGDQPEPCFTELLWLYIILSSPIPCHFPHVFNLDLLPGQPSAPWHAQSLTCAVPKC